MSEGPTDEQAREGLFSFLSRRRFLKAGLVAGGAVLGAGGGGLLRQTMPAPTVLFVSSSMTMKAPVARFWW